jgi:hypothetical protein
MKKLQGKLTYANVISTLCLFLLLGGGAAFAATQLPKHSVGTKQLKNGAVTPVKLSARAKKALKGAKGATGATGATGLQGPAGTPATKLWAVLDGEGTLVRGSGVMSTGHPGTGRQTVIFNQNVSACTFIATPGTTTATSGSGSFPTPGEVSVGPLEGNANGVVISRAEESVVEDFPVYVAVFC